MKLWQMALIGAGVFGVAAVIITTQKRTAAASPVINTTASNGQATNIRPTAQVTTPTTTPGLDFSVTDPDYQAAFGAGGSTNESSWLQTQWSDW